MEGGTCKLWVLVAFVTVLISSSSEGRGLFRNEACSRDSDCPSGLICQEDKCGCNIGSVRQTGSNNCFENNTLSHKFKKGQSPMYECYYESHNGTVARWIKEETNKIISTSKNEGNDSQVSILALSLHDFDLSMTGNYLCQLISDNTFITTLNRIHLGPDDIDIIGSKCKMTSDCSAEANSICNVGQCECGLNHFYNSSKPIRSRCSEKGWFDSFCNKPEECKRTLTCQARKCGCFPSQTRSASGCSYITTKKPTARTKDDLSQYLVVAGVVLGVFILCFVITLFSKRVETLRQQQVRVEGINRIESRNATSTVTAGTPPPTYDFYLKNIQTPPPLYDQCIPFDYTSQPKSKENGQDSQDASSRPTPFEQRRPSFRRLSAVRDTTGTSNLAFIPEDTSLT